MTTVEASVAAVETSVDSRGVPRTNAHYVDGYVTGILASKCTMKDATCWLL